MRFFSGQAWASTCSILTASRSSAGPGLAQDIAREFNIEADGSTDLALISQIVVQRHGRPKLNTFLREETGRTCSRRGSQVAYVSHLEGRLHDQLRFCYRALLQLNPDPTQRPVVMSASSEVKAWDPRFDVPIVHLHGGLATSEGVASILITQDDYARYQERRRMLFDDFRTDFPKSTVLYIGYSHRDTNWKQIVTDVRYEYSPTFLRLRIGSPRPLHCSRQKL